MRQPLAALFVLIISSAGLQSRAEEPRTLAPERGRLPLHVVAQWESPRVDVARLIAEDDAMRERKDVPLRIGFPMTVDLAPANHGTWEELEGGDRVWRLKVRTEGARWTVIGFDLFNLQPGGELTVYDPDRHTVMGPYTAADVQEHGQLWFPPIAGDTLVTELYWPDRLRDEEPRLHLGTVSHGYKRFGVIGSQLEPGGGGPDLLVSGACEIDVACPLGAAWQDQKRGVVALLSGGSAFCSASLINTTANDCRPYVLTAAHCGAGASTTFAFNFERPACNSGTPPPITNQTVTGATVLANFPSSDFTLLRMNSSPPESFNVYYNGWSRDATPATESTGIHHPDGDVKKISFNDDPLINGTNWGPNHWRVTEWEQAATEPGSSGSPLFDQNHRIVGQLHGGTSSCSSITYDEYGKVASSWTGGGTAVSRLSDWLDPVGTAALTMNGVDWQTCAIQLAGTVDLTEDRYACSDTLVIALRDDHLQGQATVNVTLSSMAETAPETVTLNVVQPNTGRFAGTFTTTPSAAVTADNLLSVAHGDTITARYIDADDGAGHANVVVTDTAAVDCAPPVITNVQATNVSGSSAHILWNTDEAANSSVSYGLTPPPSSTTQTAPFVTSHDAVLGGLQECSNYVFSVASADSSGNSASDDNAGSYYGLTTGINVQPDYASADTPLAIPDNNPTGATSTIPVADNRTVVDVNVRVNITHPYDGDIALSLITPTNQTISLSNRHGSDGNNYTNTVFDDEAATAIASGAPPFTGSFKPETPLSAADGINAAGNWRLKVVDQANADLGTIDSWHLLLTYPPQACGPHGRYKTHVLVTDSCPSGGPGASDGKWDSGEQVVLSVSIENDGTDPLTGISVQLTPITPGVTVLDGQASYPDVPAGGIAASQSPHFTIKVPESIGCGGSLQLALQITSDQGNWSGSLSQTAGQVLSGNGTALSANFESGMPAGFTVVDSLNDGKTWFIDDPSDPAGCANTDPLPPIAGHWAAVDSDCAGTGVAMDEQLITPALDLSTAQTVTIDFDHWFRRYQAEICDLDVRSPATGNAWVNVARWTGTSTTNPKHETLSLTAQAAGATNVQVRWRYYNADFEWTWFVDNVAITTTAPSGCNMDPCSTAPGSPPPVPDGTGAAQPMRARRLDAAGTQLEVTWDAPCPATTAKIVGGPLGQVGSYSVTVQQCGAASPSVWSVGAAGDLWFLVVNSDGSGTEGSWGQSSSGERNGLTASGSCGDSAKDTSASCP